MEKDTVLKQWEDGVSLGSAWWVYADLPKKKRFRELQQAASPSDPAPHMGFRIALEAETVDRLSSGELQAFGVEFGRTGEPVAILKNYFWKGAEIDLDNDTVTALGRKFGQITVQGNREPHVESLPEMAAVNLGQILTDVELPPVSELHSDSEVIRELEMEAMPRADAPRRENSRRGRPSKEEEIERAIDILLGQGVDLARMPRPKAYKAVRKCAETDVKSNTEIGFTDPVIQRALFRRFGRRR